MFVETSKEEEKVNGGYDVGMKWYGLVDVYMTELSLLLNIKQVRTIRERWSCGGGDTIMPGYGTVDDLGYRS